MEKLKLKTTGMSCFTSEDRIKTGILYLEGITACEANCSTGEIYCEYDESLTSAEIIKRRLDEMGFKTTM